MQKLKEIDFVREGKRMLKDYLLIVLGTLIAGWAFGSFFLPYDLAPGGVTGISTILAKYLPLSVGALSFIINVPLFLLGWRTVGWRFAVRSFIAMSLLSLFIDVLPKYDLTGEIMLASAFGGVLMGAGLGMVVRGGATTGGTDMAAQMIHNVIGFASVATILLAIDAAVVSVAALTFGMEAPRLKKIVAEIDPGAFVTVCNVHEALGEGFTGIKE